MEQADRGITTDIRMKIRLIVKGNLSETEWCGVKIIQRFLTLWGITIPGILEGMKRQILPHVFLLLILAMGVCVHPVDAEMRRLHLSREGSSAKVSLSSNVINTRATLREMEGEFVLDSGAIERSTFSLKSSLSSVQFPSMPVEQMFIIQGLIGSVPNKNFSFSSSSIQRVSDSRVIVSGIAESGRRREKLTIPLEILKVGETLSRFRGVLKKTFSGRNDSPQLALLGDVSCDGDFVLEFRA